MYYLFGNVEVMVRRLLYGNTKEEIFQDWQRESEAEYELYLKEQEEREEREERERREQEERERQEKEEQEQEERRKHPLKRKIWNIISRFGWATWNKTEYDRHEYVERLTHIEEKLENLDKKLDGR